MSIASRVDLINLLKLDKKYREFTIVATSIDVN
jgi:hypothetical protein